MKKWMISFGFILISFFVFSQENQSPTDDQGRRHGVWKQYYPNSTQLRYEGEFKNGKEIGEFRFYCEKCGSKPNAIKIFNPNDDIAEVKFFEKGKLISEGKMDGKMHIGKWVYYHKNSNRIMTEEHYSNGKLDGLKITYYPNGKIAEEQQFKDGIQEGKHNYYSSQGVLLKKLIYKNNQLDGPAIYYDAKGNVLVEGTYKNGVRHGKWRHFENGELTKEETFPKK